MLKPILIAGLLGVNLSAWAVVDWTPYLKSIKDECKVFEVEQALGGGKKVKIYKKLQPSITKYTHTVEKTDVRLKNATAFGQPITRIVVEHPETSYAGFTIYFANNNFTKLKSQFKTQVNGKTFSVGKKQAWAITSNGTYDENDMPTNPSYTSISQKQIKQIKDNLNNSDSDSKFYGVFEIHENGWSYHTQGEFSSLLFNTKNKSISCDYGM